MDGAPAIQDVNEVDWQKIANSALARSDTRYAKKLGRRKFGELLTGLSNGLPLQTCSRMIGVLPETVWRWADAKPALKQAIEQARAHGEALYIKRIANASQWQAQQYLLALANEEYAARREGGSHGPQIIVQVNVPPPQDVRVGERPVIDVTPAQPALEQPGPAQPDTPDDTC